MPLKFCVNCKHHVAYGTSFEALHYCQKEAYRDLVTGDPLRQKCHIVRDDEARCGTDAKWFELKEQNALI